MLRIMFHKSRLRQALALLERPTLGNRQLPQTRQISAARARLAQFIRESLTFQTI